MSEVRTTHPRSVYKKSLFRSAWSGIKKISLFMMVPWMTIEAHAQISVIQIDASDQKIIEDAQGTISFLDRPFVAKDYSGIAGVNSSLGYLLVVSGEISTDTLTAKSGDVVLIPPYQQPVSKYRFDSNRFQKELTLSKIEYSTAFEKALRLLIKRQSRSIFWGRYEPTRVNIAVPESADKELARRSVLSNETVQSIRYSTEGDPTRLEAAVVGKFEDALKSRDIDAVASLLDPLAFGSVDLRQGGIDARQIMARRIVNSTEWPSALAGRSFEKTDQPGVWELQNSASPVLIGLKSAGDFIYVAYVGEGE